MTISIQELQKAIAGNATALRFESTLVPVAGSASKVFPATYDQGKYAHEQRLIDGHRVDCVLLDSVQSQANRIEQALLDAANNGRLPLPRISVLIADRHVTSLDAPHRIYDAIFRDSLIDGVRFRESELGRKLLSASVGKATALLANAPNVLLFGGWDSHGSEGGAGTKVPRALVSEIYGINVVSGKRTSSRIDPLAINLQAGPVYQSKDEAERWTLDAAKAKQNEKGGPLPFGKDGRPSEIGHGNIVPTIDDGGVTMSEACHKAVLSLPQLRRLHFPDAEIGELSTERDDAGRCLLAALAIAGLALQSDAGYDLRSRCLLIPATTPKLQLIGQTMEQVQEFPLTTESALALFGSALEIAAARGLEWHSQVVTMTASDNLVELVRRSA